jgi:protocatechuate 3,4-dioxygenase beta subunit
MSKKESPQHPTKNQATPNAERQSPQSRREALALLGVTGVSLLVGCGSDATSQTGSGGVAGSGGATGGSGGTTGGTGGATGGSGGSTGGVGGATGGTGGSTGGTGGSTGGAAGSTGGTAGSGGSTGGAAGKAGAGGAAGSGGSTAGAAGSGGTTGGAAGKGGAAGTGGSAGGSSGAGGSVTDAGPGGADAAIGDSGGGGGFDAGACPTVDTPHVNVGPYYYDSMLNRSNITETKTGVPITFRFTVLDANCKPIAGAVVDVWHCDVAGVYSAYASQNTTGQLWLRGFQITDAHGQATFTSIFPGWYSGRLTHLHGKIFLNGVQKDTTNFFFPKTVETAVYNSPLYASRGQNSVTVAQDVELKGDTASYNALMMTVTGDVTNGYVASYVIKYS